MSEKPKPPPPGSDMKAGFFPDLETAPGKVDVHKLTPEQIAEAHRRFNEAATRGKPGK